MEQEKLGAPSTQSGKGPASTEHLHGDVQTASCKEGASERVEQLKRENLEIQLEIEREAIKRENDEPKLQTIGKELAELVGMTADGIKWNLEKLKKVISEVLF